MDITHGSYHGHARQFTHLCTGSDHSGLLTHKFSLVFVCGSRFLLPHHARALTAAFTSRCTGLPHVLLRFTHRTHARWIITHAWITRLLDLHAFTHTHTTRTVRSLDRLRFHARSSYLTRVCRSRIFLDLCTGSFSFSHFWISRIRSFTLSSARSSVCVDRFLVCHLVHWITVFMVRTGWFSHRIWIIVLIVFLWITLSFYRLDLASSGSLCLFLGSATFAITFYARLHRLALLRSLRAHFLSGSGSPHACTLRSQDRAHLHLAFSKKKKNYACLDHLGLRTAPHLRTHAPRFRFTHAHYTSLLSFGSRASLFPHALRTSFALPRLASFTLRFVYGLDRSWLRASAFILPLRFTAPHTCAARIQHRLHTSLPHLVLRFFARGCTGCVSAPHCTVLARTPHCTSPRVILLDRTHSLHISARTPRLRIGSQDSLTHWISFCGRSRSRLPGSTWFTPAHSCVCTLVRSLRITSLVFWSAHGSSRIVCGSSWIMDRLHSAVRFAGSAFSRTLHSFTRLPRTRFGSLALLHSLVHFLRILRSFTAVLHMVALVHNSAFSSLALTRLTRICLTTPLSGRHAPGFTLDLADGSRGSHALVLRSHSRTITADRASLYLHTRSRTHTCRFTSHVYTDHWMDHVYTSYHTGSVRLHFTHLSL